MKFLFVMKYPLVDPYSLMQKFNGELNAVRNLGHEVYYISFDRDFLYLDNGKKREKLQKTTLGHMKHYFHTLVFYDIYHAAQKAIMENDFDVVYFRFSPLNRPGCKMMETAAQRSTLVVEVPSVPPYTSKAKNALRAVYHKRSKKLWETNAHYATLMTGCGEPTQSLWGVPFLNIDNGIDVSLIPPKKESRSADGKLHLLAVASMCQWHGYERLINGLAQWNSEEAKQYVIDFVGSDGDGSLAEWKKLTIEKGLSEQVIFHGRLTGDALTEMYDQAVLGVSTLALYKLGYSAGSVLKLREYMARGIPFIYAHDDPHMSPDMKWCFKIPNDASPVPMPELHRFVLGVLKEQNLAEQMRSYAKAHMSWESQFESIIKRLGETA